MTLNGVSCQINLKIVSNTSFCILYSYFSQHFLCSLIFSLAHQTCASNISHSRMLFTAMFMVCMFNMHHQPPTTLEPRDLLGLSEIVCLWFFEPWIFNANIFFQHVLEWFCKNVEVRQQQGICQYWCYDAVFQAYSVRDRWREQVVYVLSCAQPRTSSIATTSTWVLVLSLLLSILEFPPGFSEWRSFGTPWAQHSVPFGICLQILIVLCIHDILQQCCEPKLWMLRRKLSGRLAGFDSMVFLLSR